MQEAHKIARDWAELMQKVENRTFVAEFKKEKLVVLSKFVSTLRQANKKHLINNFDIQNMSLPLEYSLENNFWCTQAFHM